MAAELNVLDRLARTADAVALRGFERDQHRELEPFVPEVRCQLPGLVPRLPLVTGVERERDEREARQTDPGRHHVELELIDELSSRRRSHQASEADKSA